MRLEYDEVILSKIEQVEVVGSSFFSVHGKEDAQKPNWTPTPKNESFRPVGRWENWNLIQKLLFKRIAGEELIDMGYVNDMNW